MDGLFSRVKEEEMNSRLTSNKVELWAFLGFTLSLLVLTLLNLLLPSFGLLPPVKNSVDVGLCIIALGVLARSSYHFDIHRNYYPMLILLGATGGAVCAILRELTDFALIWFQANVVVEENSSVERLAKTVALLVWGGLASICSARTCALCERHFARNKLLR